MRLWHYEILPYLPKGQLLSQWKELNTIFVTENKHILWNYVYTCSFQKKNLYYYSLYVIKEMINRGYKINSYDNMYNYFKDKVTYEDFMESLQHLDNIQFRPYFDYHNDRYLLQNFFNLQEKYDRHQKDFYTEEYIRLSNFIKSRFGDKNIQSFIK